MSDRTQGSGVPKADVWKLFHMHLFWGETLQRWQGHGDSTLWLTLLPWEWAVIQVSPALLSLSHALCQGKAHLEGLGQILFCELSFPVSKNGRSNSLLDKLPSLWYSVIATQNRTKFKRGKTEEEKHKEDGWRGNHFCLLHIVLEN